jgi:Tfp pilus assembly protein PilN
MKKTLNLLPPLAKQPIHLRKTVLTIGGAAVIYIVALAVLWFMSNYELGKLNSTINDLRGRKSQMQDYIAVSATPPAAPRDTTDEEIMNIMRVTPPWDAILAELSFVVPGTVWLEIISSSDARHLRLKGFSTSQSDVAKLISRLERSHYFRNVEIVFSQKGEQAITFELRTEIKWT